MSAQNTNRLIHESSPYLRQHAHNPVDWYPWGEEALRRAREEDRPIFVSIGYSACHWCHVMERESFEDPEIAELMNRYFVNIKVDREERPDLDKIYMQSVMLMTGRGGWPMSVWLTPKLAPFYGGTYFPPRPAVGMPSFPQLLETLGSAWQERRSETLTAAEEMAENLRRLEKIPDGPASASGDLLELAYRELRSRYDPRHGGFGSRPKFPNTFNLQLFLRVHRRSGRGEALNMVERTLTRMARGGIYDQLGGGFHRYSTDAQWLLPHFEKMLYDNALLADVYLEGWQATGDPLFRQVTTETLDYVLREMTHPEGGFYSTQDADSEGEEGKFYVWIPQEVEEVLGPDHARIFNLYYDVTPAGNYQEEASGHATGKSILNLAWDIDVAALKLGMKTAELEGLLPDLRRKMLESRERRVHPGLDDKVLASWNGLMLAALSRAYGAFGEARYLQAARANARFLLGPMRREDGRLCHSWKDGRAAGVGYADDYATVIAGLLALYQVDFETQWLAEARALAELVLERFWDPEDRALFLSDPEVKDLVVRPKEFEDGATPSGNNVFLECLLVLGRLTGEPKYLELTASGIERLGGIAARLPSGFGVLLRAFDLHSQPPVQIVLAGPAEPQRPMLQAIYRRFLPEKVVLRAGEGVHPELLQGKDPVHGKLTAYVCEAMACRPPVTDPEELPL